MKKVHLRLLCAIGAACLGASVSSKPASAESLYGSRGSFWQAEVGVRSTFITHPGFDPFSDNDALPQVSLGVARTIWAQDRLSFAPGIIWDYGERESTARGLGTSLTAQRIALALEGRYHFAPWFYGLARFTPGAVRESVRLDDPIAPSPLVARQWVAALDASAGAAFLIAPHGDQTTLPVGFWIAAEGGYSFARSASLVLRPDLAEGDPRRTGEIDMGTLAMRGAFFRIYGSVTY
jgi:hypothetical protein